MRESIAEENKGKDKEEQKLRRQPPATELWCWVERPTKTSSPCLGTMVRQGLPERKSLGYTLSLLHMTIIGFTPGGFELEVSRGFGTL